VIRTKSQDKENLIAILRRLIVALQVRAPENQLWIVEENRIRFRL
jgi:hypothetical protein